MRLDDPVTGPLLGTISVPNTAAGRRGGFDARDPAVVGKHKLIFAFPTAAWTSIRSVQRGLEAESELLGGSHGQRLNRRRFLGAAIGTGAAVAGAGSLAPAAPAAVGSRAAASRAIAADPAVTMRRVMDNSQDDARRVLRWLGRAGSPGAVPALRVDRAAVPAELDAPGCACSRATAGLDLDPPTRPGGTATAENLEYAAELGQEYTGLVVPAPYTEERFRRSPSR